MIGKVKLTSTGYDPAKGSTVWDRTLDVTWVWSRLPEATMSNGPRGTGPGPGQDGPRMTSWLGGGAEVRPGVFKGGGRPVNLTDMAPAAFLQVGEVQVCPWAPQAADDPAWKPTQIHVNQVIPGPDPNEPPIVITTRLKTERAAAEHIQSLVDAFKVVYGLRTFC